MHEPNPEKNNRDGRSYFDLKIVSVLGKIVSMLGAGDKQRWLGPIVVGWWGRQTESELANRKVYSSRFAWFKSLDSAPVLGAANGAYLTCERWCETYLETEVRT